MNNKIANVFLLAFAVALPLTACDKKEETKAEPTAMNNNAAGQPGMDAEDRAEKVEEASEKKIEAVEEGKIAAGTPMNITGEVDSKVSAKAFKLEAVNELWGEEVLVLTKNDLTIEEGAKVKVDGTVQKLVVAEIERELGWDLEPKLEAEYSEKNVIVAQNVTAVADE